jgi:predicted dehydrogenase
VANHSISRRHFFVGTLLAGAVPTGGYGTIPSLKALGYRSPNEKMNFAAIGAGGKGFSDIAGCASENLVAMVDPDEKRAARAFEKYPDVPKYTDFRRMFDKETKNIDAVIVSAPDHVHGTASMWAMVRGKHVYCQKPLTRTVWEAQELGKGAVKYKVATQMGNQGYSNEGARQCCEIIWSGEIGPVREVHAWTNRPLKYWPQGPEVVPQQEPIPPHLDWEAWLAGSEYRPYSPAYAPHHWRGFPEFGCGAIGDMACHILGTPNMALRLGAPTSVECLRQEGKSQYTFPKASLIKFEFPARGAMPPLTLYWHDGLNEQPKIEGVPEGELIGDSDVNGSLFVGEKGMVTTGCYGERSRLLPATKMADYTLPDPVLSRSPGHYRDWIRACKGGEPSCSNFTVAGPFVAWMLLGVISMQYEGKLLWDDTKGQFTNNKEANAYLKPKFRKDWKFAG